jgi:hypothetical protein
MCLPNWGTDVPGIYRRPTMEVFVRIVVSFVAFVCLAGSACAQSESEPLLSGELTAETPRASVIVSLEAGQLVSLTTSSTENLDTILTLSGPGGKTVAENDDQQAGMLSSRIIHMPSSSGDFAIAVSGYEGATGPFELHITHGLDVGLSAAASTLEEDVVALDLDRTSARFDVELAAEDIFVASTFALTASLDTILVLRDAEGATVTQNDDSGDGSLNSQLVYQAVEAGRFELEVSSFSGSDVGELVLSLALDPNADVPFNFDTIEGEALESYTGAITSDAAPQAFDVEIAAGQTLFAIADATSGDLDVVLRLMGPDGFAVAMNDDRGDGSLNSAFAYTAPETDTYTIMVERYRDGESSGEFQLNLSSVDASVVDVLLALLDNSVSLSGTEQTIETEDFRVHYTLEGPDASSHAYAQSVGETLQTVLDLQVKQIGWAEPIRDQDGRYRAYVADAEGSMGLTRPVQIIFDNPNTSDVRELSAARTLFIIDNDFEGMDKAAPTESLMRATVTHEFNHVVQYGYDSEEGLDWLYEATASWTETTTVGSDQDATDYVETDYDAPEVCWTTSQDGYDYAQWTLLQSMADTYGDGFVVDIWENSVELDGFETLAVPLAGVGANIPDVIQRWRAQNYALAYDLAPLFDTTVRLHHTLSDVGVWTSKGGLEQLGANYIALDLDGQYGFAISSEADVEMLALGLRNGEIQAISLGREGSLDTGDFESVALMVFNRTMPDAPGECSGVGYTIEVSSSTNPVTNGSYRFDASNFTPPT